MLEPQTHRRFAPSDHQRGRFAEQCALKGRVKSHYVDTDTVYGACGGLKAAGGKGRGKMMCKLSAELKTVPRSGHVTELDVSFDTTAV